MSQSDKGQLPVSTTSERSAKSLDAWFRKLIEETQDPDQIFAALFVRLEEQIADWAAGVRFLEPSHRDDLVSDFTLRLLNLARQERDLGLRGSSLQAYLREIFRRIAIDLARKIDREKKYIQKLSQWIRESEIQQEPPEIEMNDLRDKVREAIRHLPEPCQTVVRLRAYEGWPYCKIAQKVGRTEGYVRLVYFRGLATLRRWL